VVAHLTVEAAAIVVVGAVVIKRKHMKNVNWTNVLVYSRTGQELIPDFVDGLRPLRSLRKECPKGSVVLREIYKLEKMGVRRAKAAARKALNRRYKVS
jgi:coenzyme F420-reducing hydrogenase beta subunit